MAKLLFISNLAHSIGSFSMSGINSAHHLGIDFYMAANWQKTARTTIDSLEDEYHVTIANAPIARSPFAKTNIVAYRQLISLIQKEKIDYIHCNTPVGGMLGRLAGKRCGVKKVIYQAHGFHFYKGSPKLNWLLYYPVEKWLAHYTDAIITINREDYELAKSKLKLRRGGKVYYVPGVGIDTSLYTQSEVVRAGKRAELGLPPEAFVLISAGELGINKNNTVILSALEKLGRTDIHYVLCGTGEQRETLEKQAAAAGLEKQVHFLGFRNDVKDLYAAADCFVMPSFREGLSRSMMEAMASGLPVVCSDIRGNVDLIEDGENGFLCAPTDCDGFAAAIQRLANDKALREQMKQNNLKKIRKFDISIVEEKMKEIYQEILK